MLTVANLILGMLKLLYPTIFCTVGSSWAHYVYSPGVHYTPAQGTLQDQGVLTRLRSWMPPQGAA